MNNLVPSMPQLTQAPLREGFIFLMLLVLLPLFVLVPLPQDASAQSILPSLGRDRSGLSGFQFTKINVDARSAAMGSSTMADATGASSLYWNPAMASVSDESEVMMAHTAYFADIPMNYLAGFYLRNGLAIGASIHSLSSGEMDVTTEFSPEGTGQTFKTSHYSIGLTASQQLTESFSYGLTLRYLNEDLFDISYPTFGIDFGFFYRITGTGIRFGVAISNFGVDAKASGTLLRPDIDGGGNLIEETDLQTMLLPTRFSIGAAFDVLKSAPHTLLLTTQVTNPSDNAEQFSFGLEYGFLERVFLRTGYSFGVEEARFPSVGAGVTTPLSGNRLTIDYAYNSFERLGPVHRMSLRISR